MNRKARLICIAAGVAVAGAAATADAAKPLTPQERAARSQEIRENHRNFQQPRTMAQAEARIAPLPGGGAAVSLPTELWSHLSAQRDASGAIRVHEADGDTMPATLSGGTGHE